MRRSFFYLLLVLAQPLCYAKLVDKKDIQPFASKFNCSNPMLQWQFDHLTTIFDQNKAVRSLGYGDLPIIDDASDVGGDSGYLYRGVTNRQFNEAQILKLIFNDSTSVSESRWLTADLFEDPAITKAGDLVQRRASFQELPYQKQCDTFKEASLSVSKKIEDLLNDVRKPLNAFSDHVHIRGSYNGTPQAIQFLTPHKDAAERYGEFVLYVKEVVKRGIDVETYNTYAWGHRRGDIYVHDRDEYMVPSHIPSWDVQRIKVRNGTGWHKGDYGPPIYYYSKITEVNNPCNVLAVQIDKPTTSGDRSVPVGVLLRCKKGRKCASSWDGALPAAQEERLKAVVASAKVDGESLYYVPYERYIKLKPEDIVALPLADLVQRFEWAPEDLKKNKAFWKTVILSKHSSDLASANELARVTGLASDPDFLKEWKQDLEKELAKHKFHVVREEMSTFLEVGKALKLSGQAQFIDVVMRTVDENLAFSAGIFGEIEKVSAGDPEMAPLLAKAQEKKKLFSARTPEDEVRYVRSLASGENTDAMVQSLARAFVANPSTADKILDMIPGTASFKNAVLQSTFDFIARNPKAFPSFEAIEICKKISPRIQGLPGEEFAMGACIDLAVSRADRPALLLAQDIGKWLKLPADRELDTIRGLWELAKQEKRFSDKKEKGGGQLLFLNQLKAALYSPLSKRAKVQDPTGAQATALKENFVQFYTEFVSPPAQFLAYEALKQIADVTKNPTILQPPASSSQVSIGNQGIQLTPQIMDAVFASSMSVEYLLTLWGKVGRAESYKELKPLQEDRRRMIEKMKRYVAEQLAVDIQLPVNVSLIRQRYENNRMENLVALVSAFASSESNPALKTRLAETLKVVRDKFPEMPTQGIVDLHDVASSLLPSCSQDFISQSSSGRLCSLSTAKGAVVWKILSKAPSGGVVLKDLNSGILVNTQLAAHAAEQRFAHRYCENLSASSSGGASTKWIAPTGHPRDLNGKTVGKTQFPTADSELQTLLDNGLGRLLSTKLAIWSQTEADSVNPNVRSAYALKSDRSGLVALPSQVESGFICISPPPPAAAAVTVGANSHH